ncbi:PaaI family thioesterase [Thermoflavimicrobium dichotomicum]|uniref:Uncharacterized domain 1-containing protein n=1 Tax=Thermoflavimicrobium dichotomicum TaxID=46223 RepID=A0A1I3S881_9BACL|nr:PaaI family thioesterase [Thermoflavimicrobium dichotomicum]SFJ54610.1 uncharacterized domain 1-containing protein [Thermoflavimicrobium dichotomicum]
MDNEFFKEVLESGSVTDRLLLDLVQRAILKMREKRSTHLYEMIGFQGRWTGKRSYRFETDVTPFLHNLNGVVHGGIVAYIADTAMGSLVHRLLPPDKMSVTSEIKINYISAVREGKLITLADVLHLGKRTAVAECKLYTGAGDLVAASSASFVILDQKR